MKDYQKIEQAFSTVLVVAVLVSIAVCRGAGTEPPSLGTSVRSDYERLKSPGMQQGLERTLANLTRAQFELRSLQAEGRMLPLRKPGGLNPLWSDYLDRSNTTYHALFYSEAGPIRVFMKRVFADDKHEVEIQKLGYQLDYDKEGKVELYRRRVGTEGLQLFPKGGIQKFWADIDDHTAGEASWDTDGKLQGEGVSSHPLRSEKGLPEWENVLRHGDNGRKAEAVQSMIMVGSASIPYALSVLRDADDESRCQAATVFGFLREKARPRFPELAHRLREDPSAAVRKKIALSLGQIGSSARAAIPALQKASTDADPDVANAAKSALHRIQEPSTE